MSHPARASASHWLDADPFRLLVESLTDLCVTLLDRDGRILSWNAGGERMKGYRPDEVVGRPCSLLYTPDDAATGLPGRELATAAADGRYSGQGWRTRRDGSRFWAEVMITALHDGGGSLVGYAKVVRDRTEHREAEEALRQSEATLRSLLQSAPDGVLTVDGARNIVSVNAQAERMFGYSAGELVGQPIETLVPERLRSRHHGHRERFAGDPSARPMGRGLDLTARRKDGTEFPVEIGLGPVASSGGEDGQRLVICFVTDITARKHAQDQVAHQATHDPLTGLPNRRLFLDHLRLALSQGRRRPGSVAVLFLDLDRFKVVNDSLGHDAGDRLLAAVAVRLQELLRPGDTVARFGGDEFAMICSDLDDVHDAAAIAERLLRALADPFRIEERDLVVTPSIGIALATGPGGDPEALVRDADAAMYRAKERGKACYELFDGALRARVVRRLETENELRRAIELEELTVAYQPIVTLPSRRVVGAEALVRWSQPGRGPVSPAEFVPIAEETGLITAIGSWVLSQACRDAAAWGSSGRDEAPTVSVNLSVRQLAQTDLVAEVNRTLATTGLDPGRLCLEVTESALMEDLDTCVAALRSLSALGVRVAIDDFGTGYSSLSRLRHFPVDFLKIDRALVKGLGGEPDDLRIAAAVVSLAHAFGTRAVAEGVETVRQLAALERLGCDLAQGFLFARPGPAAVIPALFGAEPITA